MWYAVWVKTGQEEKILQLCNELIRLKQTEAFEECFLPRYEKYRKRNGKTELLKELLFPGYLFFISEYPDELGKLLKKIPGFAQLLGDDDGPIPLYPQEEAFLRKYTNADKVVEMSHGYILGERIIVTDGPMKDYQGKIVHIDRHKRKAVLEVEFFGRRTEVTVGLEIVKKG